MCLSYIRSLGSPKFEFIVIVSPSELISTQRSKGEPQLSQPPHPPYPVADLEDQISVKLSPHLQEVSTTSSLVPSNIDGSTMSAPINEAQTGSDVIEVS